MLLLRSTLCCLCHVLEAVAQNVRLNAQLSQAQANIVRKYRFRHEMYCTDKRRSRCVPLSRRSPLQVLDVPKSKLSEGSICQESNVRYGELTGHITVAATEVEEGKLFLC